MARLSLAVVVHREQGFLEPLVASFLDQAPADAEIVAIDDASPDHAPVLLDELAERDPRVRVRHLPTRVGLGEGRNLALEMVEGEYVWFVRTTGLLAPGALRAVLDRLEGARPDLLLVQHERATVTGDSKPGAHRGLLRRVADTGVVTLDHCPELARLAPGAQNKLFRRQLVHDLGVRFGRGGHGELSVTWPALLAAERIAAEPAPSYVGRTPPNAVRDEHTDGTPFDALDGYEAVFGFAAAHPELPGARRELVVPAMWRHVVSLLGRVPAGERQAFFEQARELALRHAPGARLPRWRAFHLRRRTGVARGAVRRWPRSAAGKARRRLRRARGTELQRYYRARLREPVDPRLAVFAAYWYRGYSCNPRAIYERARELVPDLRGVWVVNADAADTMPAGVEYVIAGSREYYDLIARAAYFVNNVNFPNHLVKRKGTTHVMTHHGTPVKRMGFDLVDAPGADSRVGFAGLLRRCSRWDFSVTQNAFTTVAWERAFPTRYETLEVGYPRNDVLASATDEDVRRVRAELGIDPEQQVVLYAPTHREYLPEYTPMLDLAALADGLGPGYIVMARLHYLYGEDPHLRELHAAGRIRDVAAHPSVEDLCLAADALVTDYSSIMFDYGVLDRPIVIHAPDWDEYRARRGTYLDLVAEAPGVVTATEEQLIAAFRSGAAFDDEARERRAAFRARFCYLDDGHAAERVIRRVWLGERDPAPAPPAVVLR